MKSIRAEEAAFLGKYEKSRRTGPLTACNFVASHDGLGPRWKFWRRRRDVLCIMSFFGFVNVALLRSNLSVAIVAMTSAHPVYLTNGTIVQERDFNWDSVSKGIVLSAFFYGYILSQIPGGWLAYRFGGHRTYGLGVSITALLTLVTPILAQVHIYLMVAARIAEGVCEGLTFPSMEFLIARWMPVLERNRFGSAAFTGMPLGIIVSMVLSGYLASYVGWESVFYVSGSLGAVWATFWWILASEDPATDSRISVGESSYIIATRAYDFNTMKAHGAIPWLRIVSSVPVCSALFAAFVTAWNFQALITQLPTFVKETIGFDLKNAGLVSSIPSAVATIVYPLHGYIIDIVLTRTLISVSLARKLSICGSLVVNSILLVSMGYLSSIPTIISCLVVAMVVDGICSTTVNLNCLDLAPQYSSIIMGIAHTLSGLAGAISPTLTGYIVRNSTLVEWRTVFGIAGGLTAVGALVYGVLGSGELQAWADDDSSQRRETSRKRLPPACRSSRTDPRRQSILPLQVF